MVKHSTITKVSKRKKRGSTSIDRRALILTLALAIGAVVLAWIGIKASLASVQCLQWVQTTEIVKYNTEYSNADGHFASGDGHIPGEILSYDSVKNRRIRLTPEYKTKCAAWQESGLLEGPVFASERRGSWDQKELVSRRKTPIEVDFEKGTPVNFEVSGLMTHTKVDYFHTEVNYAGENRDNLGLFDVEDRTLIQKLKPVSPSPACLDQLKERNYNLIVLRNRQNYSPSMDPKDLVACRQGVEVQLVPNKAVQNVILRGHTLGLAVVTDIQGGEDWKWFIANRIPSDRTKQELIRQLTLKSTYPWRPWSPPEGSRFSTVALKDLSSPPPVLTGFSITQGGFGLELVGTGLKTSNSEYTYELLSKMVVHFPYGRSVKFEGSVFHGNKTKILINKSDNGTNFTGMKSVDLITSRGATSTSVNLISPPTKTPPPVTNPPVLSYGKIIQGGYGLQLVGTRLNLSGSGLSAEVGSRINIKYKNGTVKAFPADTFFGDATGLNLYVADATDLKNIFSIQYVSASRGYSVTKVLK